MCALQKGVLRLHLMESLLCLAPEYLVQNRIGLGISNVGVLPRERLKYTDFNSI